MAYPVGFVPWTERRNMEEFLSLSRSGRLRRWKARKRGQLIPFERAPEGRTSRLGEEWPLADLRTILECGTRDALGERGIRRWIPARRGSRGRRTESRARGRLAGLHRTAETLRAATPPGLLPRLRQFASSYLLPGVRAAGAVLERVITATPSLNRDRPQAEGLSRRGTVAEDAIADPRTEIVFIATGTTRTRSSRSGPLRANRAVFVEKPLALTNEELDRVTGALARREGG